MNIIASLEPFCSNAATVSDLRCIVETASRARTAWTANLDWTLYSRQLDVMLLGHPAKLHGQIMNHVIIIIIIIIIINLTNLYTQSDQWFTIVKSE